MTELIDFNSPGDEEDSSDSAGRLTPRLLIASPTSSNPTRSQFASSAWDDDEGDDEMTTLTTHTTKELAAENKNKKKPGPELVELGHESFELVYDMLFGIRKCIIDTLARRAEREKELNLPYSLPSIILTKEDFSATYTYNMKRSNNIRGKTHEAIYTLMEKDAVFFDFTFKDFAPFVFYNLRTEFGINAAEYMDSLVTKCRLYEIVSAGKSGSFFYFSFDKKYIIKTITEHEAEHFMSFLNDYYSHMMQYKDTLLVRFFGLHTVRPRNEGKEMYFVVMDNIYPTNLKIDERYDLKGSTVGRQASEKEKSTETVIFKDLDIKKGRIDLPDYYKSSLLEQLEKDAKFLMSHEVMDYSFLVGVHYLTADTKQEVLSLGGSGSGDRLKMVASGDKGKLGGSGDKVKMNLGSIFRQTGGGALSRDGKEIYYFGIIDFFQRWNMKKRVENIGKSIFNDSTHLSAVHPSLYCERFLKFIRDHIVKEYLL